MPLPASPAPPPAALDQWSNHARQWSLIGSPLRPIAEDVEVALAEVGAWRAANGGRAARALLLGVTPELAAMAWPEGTALTAVDRSQPMIEAVFPHRQAPPRTRVLCAEWSALPLEDGSVDVVIGDGCFSVVAYPEGLQAIGKEIRRVMAPGARFVMRVFAAPEQREDLAAIARDLRAGKIGNFHCLKWRLVMATQTSSEAGATLGDVYSAFAELRPLVAELARAAGFAPETTGTIESYRGSPTTYWFPTVAQIREALADSFEITASMAKSYELGERCPTLLLRAL